MHNTSDRYPGSNPQKTVIVPEIIEDITAVQNTPESPLESSGLCKKHQYSSRNKKLLPSEVLYNVASSSILSSSSQTLPLKDGEKV